MSGLRFEFMDAFEFAELVAGAPQVVESEIVTATDRVAIYGMGVSIKATPHKTGHLRRGHALKPVSYSAGVATGGWGNAVPYAEVVEEGIKNPYTIRAKGKALVFVPGAGSGVPVAAKGKFKGKAVFKSVTIPARAGTPFMEPGREAAESRLDAEFSGAIQRIVEALGG